MNFEGLIFLTRRNFFYILNEYINSYKKNNKEIYLNNIIKIIKLISLPLQDFLIKDSLNDSEKKQIRINFFFKNYQI